MMTYERSIRRRGDGPGAFVRPTYCLYLHGRVLLADELQNCIHVVSVHPPHFDEPMPNIERIEGAIGRSEEESNALRFWYPTGMATDGSSLFVADSLNYRIQKLRLSDLSSLGCAGSKGSGDNQLKGPQDLALQGELLFVSDFWSHRIVVYDTQLNFVRSFGVTGDGVGELCKPTGIAVFSCEGRESELYVADSGNGRVQVGRRAAAGDGGKECGVGCVA